MPTQSAGSKPGPIVTAIASILGGLIVGINFKNCSKSSGSLSKTEFKISGTSESRHGSGNRCIVAVHKNMCKVCVLVVYHKNDLGGSNETASWKNLVKENYPEYLNIIN